MAEDSDGLTNTITGMHPVNGTDPTSGHRDFEIIVEREGWDEPEVVFSMFDASGAETMDPTMAIEFTPELSERIERLCVGDVITMRVVINT